jgi:hypothetical protein
MVATAMLPAKGRKMLTTGPKVPLSGSKSPQFSSSRLAACNCGRALELFSPFLLRLPDLKPLDPPVAARGRDDTADFSALTRSFP